MANVNVAFGMKPINNAGSTPATGGTNAYLIASDASAIYQGSAVKAVNGGSIAIGSASGDTVAFVGVFAGCEYVSSSTGKRSFQTTGLDQVRTQISILSGMCTTTRSSVL